MEREKAIGIAFTIGAYIFWGIFPLYWKLLDDVPPLEILAHRILWSFIFVLIIASILKRKQLKHFFQLEMSEKKTWIGLILASLLISINWLTYIFAVNTDHIIEASLGYYINPLISVLLGIFVLRERIQGWQIVSFVLAAIGVGYMTLTVGKFPWISLVLALSFGFYGLAKKLIKVDSILGLLFETLFAVPFALLFLAYLGVNERQSFLTGSIQIDLLLLGSGVATAIPLLWFGMGAQKIPLYVVGFIQYLSPTINLVIGVLVFGEAFTINHGITFTCIWLAIGIFTFPTIRQMIQRRKVSTIDSDVGNA